MKRIIIDVREPNEFVSGHVKGAVNISPTDLMNGAKNLNHLSKDTQIVVYCRSGNRSEAAMHILNQLGYNNVINGINKAHVEARYM